MPIGPSPKPPRSRDPKRDHLNNFYKYAQTYPKDVIAYVLMVFGIILLFFQHFYGGLIIGLVLGVYFSREIGMLIKHYDDFIEEQGLVRSLILGGTLLAFFITTPGVFIGAAIMVALRYVIISEKIDRP
jgi:hypothetical protein